MWVSPSIIKVSDSGLYRGTMCSDRWIRRYPVTSGKYQDRKTQIMRRLFPSRSSPNHEYRPNTKTTNEPIAKWAIYTYLVSDIIQTNHHLRADEPKCDGNGFEMLFLPVVLITVGKAGLTVCPAKYTRLFACSNQFSFEPNDISPWNLYSVRAAAAMYNFYVTAYEFLVV